jgi:hypothetical protein
MRVSQVTRMSQQDKRPGRSLGHEARGLERMVGIIQFHPVAAAKLLEPL